MSYLKITKIEAGELLKEQFDKGKELEKEVQNCNAEEGLTKLKRKYYNWVNYTEEVILKIFPTNKEKEEFSPRFGVGVWGPKSFHEKRKETIDNIERKIIKLEGLIERLEVYDEPIEEEHQGKASDVYSLDGLHPKIIESSFRLFQDKHYSQAILEAFKQVSLCVKEKSGIHDRDGASLMEYVFSLNNPVLAFNDLKTQSEKDEQLGFMLLFKGAMLGIRNPKAHQIIVQQDSKKTLEYLAFASLLLKRLDDCKKV